MLARRFVRPAGLAWLLAPLAAAGIVFPAQAFVVSSLSGSVAVAAAAALLGVWWPLAGATSEASP